MGWFNHWLEDNEEIGPFSRWLEDDGINGVESCCASCAKRGKCDIVLEDDDDDCIEWKQK